MEVKVGIRDVPREVIVETTESAADVQKAPRRRWPTMRFSC